MHSEKHKTKQNETVIDDDTALFSSERRQQIMMVVEKERRVMVSDLRERFAVSDVTIRKDLNWLEAQGLVLRTHGGAILNTSVSNPSELSIDVRQQLHHVEKERIGEVAASMIHDGETIALDASTTALAIVPFLHTKRDLTVITNGVRAGIDLLQIPGVSVMLPGGMLRKESHSLVGHWGQSILEQIHISKAFVGARGLTLHAGLTDVNAEEVELKQAIVNSAQEVIAVIDSTKWGQVTLATFCPIERLQCIITDTQAPTQMVTQFRNMGIDIQIVSAP
ncbi:DeoR family transcriptional regulator [Dictyobacter alpinus]|uniref:DeoR family transcriptional regulator n=1 Tax=Dictyobacter alpinus TaxID=2014873 RepID=A0A402BDV7_9CHLR|nr:DeoR/GlpR family DNA-binding transcription regulator [Dictyobacter alpinus]GCE29621.1 DeoR family transcriptional regulator [Dictyobacter alpinus]